MTSHDEEIECPECNGQGSYKLTYNYGPDDIDTETVECGNCDGIGSMSVPVWSSEDSLELATK